MSFYKLLPSIKLYIFSRVFRAKPITALPFDDEDKVVAESQKNAFADVTEILRDASMEDEDAATEVAVPSGLAAEGIQESEEAVISSGSVPDPAVTSPCPCAPRPELIQLSDFPLDTVYDPLFERNEDVPLIGLGLMGLPEHIKDTSTISDSLDSPCASYFTHNRIPGNVL
ncbi:hypothetical protein BKA93DRAFT_824934 [Sparassis latifolia]